MPRSFLGPQRSFYTCVPVSFLLPPVETSTGEGTPPDISRLCGDATPPSPPLFPSEDLVQPRYEKMPGDGKTLRKQMPTREKKITWQVSPAEGIIFMRPSARVLGWQDRRFF
jgi:hypothetical protein